MTTQPATKSTPARAVDTSTSTPALDQLTLRDILSIPEAAMDQAMGIAYQLYLSGRFADAEIVCKGLIACDQHYWWPHTLHASVLRRLGRYPDALAAVELGLKHEPGQPKLALMRAELVLAIARQNERRVGQTSPKAPQETRDGARDGAVSATCL